MKYWCTIKGSWGILCSMLLLVIINVYWTLAQWIITNTPSNFLLLILSSYPISTPTTINCNDNNKKIIKKLNERLQKNCWLTVHLSGQKKYYLTRQTHILADQMSKLFTSKWFFLLDICLLTSTYLQPSKYTRDNQQSKRNCYKHFIKIIPAFITTEANQTKYTCWCIYKLHESFIWGWENFKNTWDIKILRNCEMGDRWLWILHFVFF